MGLYQTEGCNLLQPPMKAYPCPSTNKFVTGSNLYTGQQYWPSASYVHIRNEELTDGISECHISRKCFTIKTPSRILKSHNYIPYTHPVGLPLRTRPGWSIVCYFWQALIFGWKGQLGDWDLSGAGCYLSRFHVRKQTLKKQNGDCSIIATWFRISEGGAEICRWKHQETHW